MRFKSLSFPWKSLRFMLTVPYVVLVLLVALIIGILSYSAGSHAVDRLSDLVLDETVNRIAQAIDKHLSGSGSVLETVFPEGISPPDSLQDDLEILRTRLWLATTIHRDPNNYAYYGDRYGQFIGLWRHSESEAELRLRTDSISPRSIYRYSGIQGALGTPEIEPRSFEPRDRPWYEAGRAARPDAWTQIYIDFNSRELVGTRTRRVDNSAGEFEGVVATDVSLQRLNSFLKTLSLSANGVAVILEWDGNIIATSRGPHLHAVAGEGDRRLNAANSSDALLAETYLAVKTLASTSGSDTHAQTTKFNRPGGAIVQAGYARIQDSAGLDWIVAVAVPRDDFMQDVTHNVLRTVGMAVLACALVVMLGFFILNRVASDLRRLAGAARAMGEGDLSASVPMERGDEIGELAKSFSDLQERLLTDRLTGIANREAIVRCIEGRIADRRRQEDPLPFALLFIDLNGFKDINDQFGHDTGDQVLVEVAARLDRALRDYDMAARFGGDEFVVLLDKAGNRDIVAQVSGRLQKALAEPYAAVLALSDNPRQFTTGASIGYALYPEDGSNFDTLMKYADEQMYSVKTALKNGPG